MAQATDQTVLGQFDGRTLAYGGITSRFFRLDGKFFVRTDGPDGRMADFEIKYTFGVSPLQQYLVELPGGRLQSLGLSWDARPAPAGGQRWFHLYANDTVKAGDPLHWTGVLQNWNFMCADCHSTNIRKGYAAATRDFHTTWSEIAVGCEACHGPGGAHVSWARRARETGAAKADPYLTARLNERKGVTWMPNAATGVPVRSSPRTTDREIAVCARCHSRRSQLTDDAKAGDPLEDKFRPSLLEPGLFHPDGQQRDEVYTYASFIQSKMFAAGVTCSDCHDPHSGKVRQPGNGLCTQCHVVSRYDTSAHHLHKDGTAAAACVTCHMPAATYMQVDPRRDHSFRVPRPDRSAELGVPDSCTGACHRDKSATWAAAELRRRTGHAPAGFQGFAEAFSAADRREPGAAAGLVRVLQDPLESPIARASAADRMAKSGLPLDPAVAAALLHDPSPMVRRATLDAVQDADVATRLRLVAPLLADPLRTVRTQAVVALVDVPAARLPATFPAALDEYIAEQHLNADRPEAQVNLATAMLSQGRTDAAIDALREAIRLDPTFVPAFVNLADIQRSGGDEAGAERTLREGLAANPRVAGLHHALGLALVRQRRLPEALQELTTSVRLSPDEARFAYVLAVALHDTGQVTDAIARLTTSSSAHPGDRDTLMLLATYLADAGQGGAAKKYAERVLAIDPADPEARALLARLR